MNTLAIKALAAASFSLLAVAPAAAQEARVINYSDLNIASAAGAEALNARIETGIKAVCGRPEVRDVNSVAAWNECRDAAMSSALEQLAEKGATAG